VPFIRKIKRGNRIYLAEVENQRDGVKVRQKLIRYLGLDPRCVENDIPFKINDLKVGPIKVFGPIIALESIARELGLFDLLGDIAEPILTLVFAHCLEYRSVDHAKEWYETTDLPNIFGHQKMPINTLHNALEMLSKRDSSAIQKSVFENLCNILGEDSSGVVYDATNTHLAGTRSSLANKGKDKEGVRGRKLIQIGLGVTRHLGIPIFHQTREGNIHDTMMFREAIQQFNEMGVRKGLMVFDRGITSKTCVLQLAKTGWHSLAGIPNHQGVKAAISNLDLERMQKFRNIVIQGDTEFFVKPIKFEIGSVHGKLLVMQNTRKRQEISRFRRLKIIKARDELRDFDISIPDELEKFFSKTKSINWHAIARAERYDGLSFIFTDAKIAVEEAVHLYFAKDIIERCFKLEKSILNLRPIRFWLDSKIKVHVLICHLALSLLTTCRIRLQKQGIYDDIGGIFKKLNSIYKVYFSIDRSRNVSFSKVNTLSTHQSRILKIIAPKLEM
jgi:DDE family transposase